MVLGIFQRWRDARAKAAAERADLQRRFDTFLAETEPFVPKSPHPKVALYRHAWKRAAVLGIIYQQQSDPARVAEYQQLEKLAGEQYFKIAPDTLYGNLAPYLLLCAGGLLRAADHYGTASSKVSTPGTAGSTISRPAGTGHQAKTCSSSGAIMIPAKSRLMLCAGG